MNKLLTRAVTGLLILGLNETTALTGGRSLRAVPHDFRLGRTQRVAPRQGSVFLVGGGKLPEAVRRRFLELAGGRKARLVIIPSASARPDAAERSFAYWKTADVACVRVLHTARRSDAEGPQVVGLLRDATAVWISGGDQCRLTGLYGGTAVERELANLLRRGGVVGGTSAGASAVCAVMMAGAGRTDKGFGLISHAIVDQHFSNRGRLPRLLGVLHRHPGQTGIGIDEETAVIIYGRDAAVLGNATVTVATSDFVRVYRAGSHFSR